MDASPPLTTRIFRGLEWLTREAPAAGHALTGDACVAVETPRGATIAIIDGLGHGQDAHAAAQAVARVIREASDAPHPRLFAACHEAARGTRGVALSVASLDVDAGQLTWSAVGNVEALLLRGAPPGRERLLLKGGVVGYRMPALRPAVVQARPGDLLIIATDGIRPEFASNPLLAAPGAPLAVVADGLFAVHRNERDDALLFVGRCLGAAGGTS